MGKKRAKVTGVVLCIKGSTELNQVTKFTVLRCYRVSMD